MDQLTLPARTVKSCSLCRLEALGNLVAIADTSPSLIQASRARTLTDFHTHIQIISTNLLLYLLPIIGNLISPFEAPAQQTWEVFFKQLLLQRTRVTFPGLSWIAGAHRDLEVDKKGDFEEVLENLNLVTLVQG